MKSYYEEPQLLRNPSFLKDITNDSSPLRTNYSQSNKLRNYAIAASVALTATAGRILGQDTSSMENSIREAVEQDSSLGWKITAASTVASLAVIYGLYKQSSSNKKKSDQSD
jgi:hypothetical protein